MNRHRVRSVDTPRRDPTADQMETLLNTLEGKNNETPALPLINVDQTIKLLIADVMREPCLLDKQEANTVHIFRVPEGLDLQGQRLVLFSMCECCRLDITSKARAEAILIQQLRKENGLDPVAVH